MDELVSDRTASRKVFAVKYAQRSARRSEHFVGGDPHDAPMDMDYFVWAIVDHDKVWVVDTGFGEFDAERRKRQLVRSVTDGLALVGVDAATVDDVILTHLHYDHVGGFHQFPNAQFHLQDDEMAYATGRHMSKPAMSHPFTVDHVADLVHHVYEGRVVFHDGDVEIWPGISLHHVGGHTEGLQVVRVATQAGWMVLASDASHYYENMMTGRPFPIVVDVGAMLEGHQLCFGLADDESLVVPGHDPDVFNRFPPAATGLEAIAVRLDQGPIS